MDKKKYSVWITILCISYLAIIFMIAAVLKSGQFIGYLEEREKQRKEINKTEILSGKNKEENTIEIMLEEAVSEGVISEEAVKEILSEEGTEEASLPEESNVSENSVSGNGVSEDNAVSMADALFIGDSRTLGIKQYSGMDEAAYFARPGMSVYNIAKDKMPVFDEKELTFEEVLGYKTYNKIYVMLGINELGYDTTATINKYSQLLQQIQEAQPEAVIFIEANLHVTKLRNEVDEIFNNPAIDKFNNELQKLADNQKIFYVDVNVLFDDADGNLDEAKSYDDTHVAPRCYVDWADWLKAQTAECLRDSAAKTNVRDSKIS